MVTQTLKTVVDVGATIDRASFNKIGSTFKRSMGESVRAVKKLEREQKDLAKQIKKVGAAGGSVEKLERRYKELGQQIDKAKRKAHAFNVLSKKVGGGFRKLGRGAKYAAIGITAASGAFTTAILMANKKTAEEAGLGKGFGVSGTTFAVWNDMAEDMGLTAQAFGKMGTDFKKKVGLVMATGKGQAVIDALERLGLSAKQFEGMKLTDQLGLIFEQLDKIDDEAMKGGLANALLGGKSVQVLNYLKSIGKSFSEFYAEKKRTNLLSDEASEAAQRSNYAMGTALNALTTGWRDISGLILKQFSPAIEDATNRFSDWYKLGGGREEIKEDITDTIDGLIKLGTTIKKTVKYLGGWKQVLKWSGIGIAGFFATVALGMVSKAIFSIIAAIGLIGGPIFLIGVAIAGLVGTLYYFRKEIKAGWDWVLNKTEAFKNRLVDKFQAIENGIGEKLKALKAAFKNMITSNDFLSNEFFKTVYDRTVYYMDKIMNKFNWFFKAIKYLSPHGLAWQAYNNLMSTGDANKPPVVGSTAVENASKQSAVSTKINAVPPAGTGQNITNDNRKVGPIIVNAKEGQSPREIAEAVYKRFNYDNFQIVN